MNKFKLTTEVNATLELLAKRINPNVKDWASWSAEFLNKKFTGPNVKQCICNICNENCDISDLNAHAYKHLKEHKLLPFL